MSAAGHKAAREPHRKRESAAAHLPIARRAARTCGVGLMNGVHELADDRSQFVAEMVNKTVEDSSYVDDRLIGLDALPDGKSLNFRARMMPF
jgi:hypothetical protein